MQSADITQRPHQVNKGLKLTLSRNIAHLLFCWICRSSQLIIDWQLLFFWREKSNSPGCQGLSYPGGLTVKRHIGWNSVTGEIAAKRGPRVCALYQTVDFKVPQYVLQQVSTQLITPSSTDSRFIGNCRVTSSVTMMPVTWWFYTMKWSFILGAGHNTFTMSSISSGG